MSSKKYATPLRLELKPSRLLLLLLLGLHLMALTLVYFLVFDLLFVFSIATLIIFSGYFVINKYALKKASSAIVSLIWGANNEWVLETKGGEIIDGELVRDSYINPSMTILIFKSGLRSSYQYVILLKDNIDANDFRRLRVRLKVGKPIEIV